MINEVTQEQHHSAKKSRESEYFCLGVSSLLQKAEPFSFKKLPDCLAFEHSFFNARSGYKPLLPGPGTRKDPKKLEN